MTQKEAQKDRKHEKEVRVIEDRMRYHLGDRQYLKEKGCIFSITDETPNYLTNKK